MGGGGEEGRARAKVAAASFSESVLVFVDRLEDGFLGSDVRRDDFQGGVYYQRYFT